MKHCIRASILTSRLLLWLWPKILPPGALAQVARTAPAARSTAFIGPKGGTERLGSGAPPAHIVGKIWREETDNTVVCVCAGLNDSVAVANLDIPTPPAFRYLNAHDDITCSGHSRQHS